MTVYESLEQKKNNLIEAAANCDYHGSYAMSDMWLGKALQIVCRMMTMTVEEAEREAC